MSTRFSISSPTIHKCVQRLLPLKSNRQIAASLTTAAIHRNAGLQNIKTLEDLTKLKSLNDVDPELIKRLINERTSELSTKNELEMLKNFDKEEQMLRQSSLKKFTRPFWIFLLMSSTVYLGYHYIWWKLEYEEKEIAYSRQVKELETELNTLLAQRERAGSSTSSDSVKRPWYKHWFF